MSNEEKYAEMFNPLAFECVSKTEFKDMYKGKSPYDLDSVWRWISKNRPKKSKKKFNAE